MSKNKSSRPFPDQRPSVQPGSQQPNTEPDAGDVDLGEESEEAPGTPDVAPAEIVPEPSPAAPDSPAAEPSAASSAPEVEAVQEAAPADIVKQAEWTVPPTDSALRELAQAALDIPGGSELTGIAVVGGIPPAELGRFRLEVVVDTDDAVWEVFDGDDVAFRGSKEECFAQLAKLAS